MDSKDAYAECRRVLEEREAECKRCLEDQEVEHRRVLKAQEESLWRSSRRRVTSCCSGTRPAAASVRWGASGSSRRSESGVSGSSRGCSRCRCTAVCPTSLHQLSSVVIITYLLAFQAEPLPWRVAALWYLHNQTEVLLGL